jgi:hypothetical protein
MTFDFNTVTLGTLVQSKQKIIHGANKYCQTVNYYKRYWA